MSDSICRWGILSTANIALKNWHSIAASGNGQVVAVASRSQEKAQAFIDTCQASVPVPQQVDAVGSYDELLGRSDIDAVYIPLPTAIRAEWVIKAAEAGKHVLVEKPCGKDAAEVQSMVDACTKSGVQFMDGVMFMHSSRLSAMRNVLDDGNSVGPIQRISSQFTFCGDDSFFQDNIRMTSNMEPAGCLGDLGWYDIRLILWALNYEMPTEVRGRILEGVEVPDNPHPLPVQFQGEMHFASGVSATFFSSFRTSNSQLATIAGSNGYLHIQDFVLPFFGNELKFTTTSNTFDSDGCRFNMAERTTSHRVSEYSNNAADAQETNLFRTFANCVNSGRIDSHWPEITLKTQRVLDAALKSACEGCGPVTP